MRPSYRWRVVHLVDLAVEVSDGGEVLPLEQGLELGEDLVEVLLESGTGEEVEHPPRQEQRDHLAGRQGDRLAPRARHDPPDLPLAHELVVQGLAGLLESVDVADRGPQADPEALGDVMHRQALS